MFLRQSHELADEMQGLVGTCGKWSAFDASEVVRNKLWRTKLNRTHVRRQETVRSCANDCPSSTASCNVGIVNIPLRSRIERGVKVKGNGHRPDPWEVMRKYLVPGVSDPRIVIYHFVSSHCGAAVQCRYIFRYVDRMISSQPVGSNQTATPSAGA